MCFTFLADSVMHIFTFFSDLTAFLSHIAFVRFRNLVTMLIVDMLTLTVFAKIRFFWIRRHFSIRCEFYCDNVNFFSRCENEVWKSLSARKYSFQFRTNFNITSFSTAEKLTQRQLINDKKNKKADSFIFDWKNTIYWFKVLRDIIYNKQKALLLNIKIFSQRWMIEWQSDRVERTYANQSRRINKHQQIVR